MDRTIDYQRRINNVINHVSADLTRHYTVDELASVAHFSKFHFLRLFKSMTGETIAQCVLRLRLEAAAGSLIYKKTLSITDVALDQGFSSSANFAKAFARQFDCSPSVFRRTRSRTDIQKSNFGKARPVSMSDIDEAGLIIEIADQADLHLAYLRNVGPYNHEGIGNMFDELISWSRDNHYLAPQAQLYGITWSDSHITDESTWRYDACVTVTETANAERSFGCMVLEGGRIARLSLTLSPSDMSKLGDYWDWLLGKWLPQSGYEPASRPSFEHYGSVTGSGGQTIRLCLPIQDTKE